MYIVKSNKDTNWCKYIITDNPKKGTKIICKTKSITDIFWYCYFNTTSDIISRLKLPKDMTHIVKSVTDDFLREKIKDSEAYKHMS